MPHRLSRLVAAAIVATLGFTASPVSAAPQTVTPSTTVSISENVSVAQVKKMSPSKPKIKGTAKVGKTLKVKHTKWTPGQASYKVQWMRNGKKIKGATKSTYTLKAKDAGKKITVTVTGKKAGHKNTSVTSKATKKIAAKAKAKTAKPKYTVSAKNCKNSSKGQSCVDSTTFSYIDFRSSGGPQWVGGHQRGQAKVILKFKKGDLVKVKGSSVADTYKVTGEKWIPRKNGIKASTLGSGFVFQTCSTDGKKMRIVYVKKGLIRSAH